MRRSLAVLIYAALLIFPISAFSAPCVVSDATGSGANSFDNLADDLNGGLCDSDTMTFSVPSVAADAGDLPFVVIRTATTIDGGGAATVSGDVGGNAGVLSYTSAGTDNTSILQNIGFKNTNTGGYAVYLNKKQTTVKNSTLTAPLKTSGMLTGENLSMSNNYVFTDTFDITKAIIIGTPALSSPDVVNNVNSALDAGGTTWSVGGTVDTDANRVELYHVDQTAKTITYIGGGTVSAGAFSLSVNLETYSPLDDYALLVMNTVTSALKTSTFSGIFVPEDDADFYTSLPNCANAAWLLAAAEGGWSGDYDGDGLTNAEEDANKNCTVETGETNPASDDTDSDGLVDLSDNCPTVSNPTQEDLDSDTIGDECDTDKDGDGVVNTSDNCPATSNVDQADTDGDGVGDACNTTTTPPTTAAAAGGCSLTPYSGMNPFHLILMMFLAVMIFGSWRKNIF